MQLSLFYSYEPLYKSRFVADNIIPVFPCILKENQCKAAKTAAL